MPAAETETKKEGEEIPIFSYWSVFLFSFTATTSSLRQHVESVAAKLLARVALSGPSGGCRPSACHIPLFALRP